ncbi:SGNH/GDSL hydrolase family protein [Saccharomonospora sp. NPDC046836]|uniref:SGNH/GDSL hydrolase family protein n=1 Tax=Saccharomonospora sp. NPDC046836 TaxID=3156921 RepID=UPI003403F170
MPYSRYVAVGDSQTEGLGDGDEIRGYRGWADRFAEELARVNPGLQYANLAVRGRLAAQIRDEQLAPALALRPDLVTVMGGVNDLIRRRFDAAQVAGCLEDMFAAFTVAGAHVVTFTFPDLTRTTRAARPLRARLLELNARIRATADRHGVTIVDTFPHTVTTDPRLWSTDRLHASPLGHTRMAAALAHTLDLPGSDPDWTSPLPPLPPRSGLHSAGTELRWISSFVGPWIYRRLRGRSSGDGRTAKRPALAPVTVRRASQE